MKKLLYIALSLLLLNFYPQSRSDIINAYVESSEEYIGVEEETSDFSKALFCVV